jgi:hypothetical protein
VLKRIVSYACCGATSRTVALFAMCPHVRGQREH